MRSGGRWGVISDPISTKEALVQMLGMAYGDLVPVLLQAIKELTGRVEALEALQSKKSRNARTGPATASR